MILLIDNYDSFVFNLYQFIGTINSDIKVIKNDELSVDEIIKLNPSHIILSPGPGRPKDAGIMEDLIKHINNIPILGVCLGHQAICEVFGFDIIKSGIVLLFHKNPNMDTLVTIGVLSSFIYSLVNLILIILGNNMLVESLYFESTAMIIYFIMLGRFIDKRSKEKTKEAIKELVQITPESALVKTKDGEKEVTIDEVKKGDILICKPCMKVAVDGVITSG